MRHLLLLTALFLPLNVIAANNEKNTIPYTFKEGDTARAASVNENFTYLLERVKLAEIKIDINKLVSRNLFETCEIFKKDLLLNAKRRVYNYKTTGKVEYDEFYPKHSKPLIDQIDSLLAVHYGFTHAELDFIINYDIKYRMGKELGGEGGDEE